MLSRFKKPAIYLGWVLLVSPFFFLNITPFPLSNIGADGYESPCYSPNREYYIERYTTLPKALYINPSYSKEGLAILYSKDGTELFRGIADDVYKPGWNGDKVGFFGQWGGQWNVKLPSDAGDSVGCNR